MLNRYDRFDFLSSGVLVMEALEAVHFLMQAARKLVGGVASKRLVDTSNLLKIHT